MTEATLITPPPAPDESGYPLPGSVAQPDFARGEREALIAEIRQLLGRRTPCWLRTTTRMTTCR